MTMEYVAQPADADIVAALEHLQPANPFATGAYFESRRRLGYSIWVVGVQQSASGLEAGCGAFLRSGMLNCTLEILSLPSLGADSVFWDGLRDLCRRRRITQLELGTFASPRGTDPRVFGARCSRRSRQEFILDLTGDLAGMLSANHRRNLKKAQKAGLSVRQTRSTDAAIVHQTLMNLSMERRRARGENIAESRGAPQTPAILQSGAGELFQAIREGSIVSSVLVLRAAKGGYYQSAGTSPEGMQIGASHFLLHSIAVELKKEGATVLNLGGADEGSTLAGFKEKFGASPVALSSTSSYVGSSQRYRIGRATEIIRSDRKTLRRLLAGGLTRMLVYSTQTGTVQPRESNLALVFRALTQEDLRTISATDPVFLTRQLERLARFGASFAYGVLVDGQIAHVSWLLPPAAIEKDPPRVVCGRATEAEITACETLPQYRGRGIYGFAIQNLLEVARSNGVRRVFMKTAPSNTASRSGIEKAGLKLAGSAIILTLPISHRTMIWRRFR